MLSIANSRVRILMFVGSFLLISAQLPGSLMTADAHSLHRQRVIRITAKQFEFSPKKISVRKGETVKLRITSKDVVHGFRITPLGIKVAVPVGETVDVLMTPTETGSLVATCSEFCGVGHKKMELTIDVKP